MKKRTFFTFFIISIVLIFSSCNSFNGAGETGEEFYNYIKNNQYDKVIGLLTDVALCASPQQDWIAGLEELKTERGKIKSFSKTSLNSEVKNGKTITVLTYNVTYSEKIYTEKITFYKDGKDYKINYYGFAN